MIRDIGIGCCKGVCGKMSPHIVARLVVILAYSNIPLRLCHPKMISPLSHKDFLNSVVFVLI
ncbi:hypothetical protein V6Z11_D01G131300 [Gossypium hirsutum]